MECENFEEQGKEDTTIYISSVNCLFHPQDSKMSSCGWEQNWQRTSLSLFYLSIFTDTDIVFTRCGSSQLFSLQLEVYPDFNTKTHESRLTNFTPW